MRDQFDMFGEQPARLPEGFRYLPGVVTPEVEAATLLHLRDLPFREFEMDGYKGKRRVVSFGVHYSMSERTLSAGEPMPSFLLVLRDAAAAFAGLSSERLEHVLVTEYGAGAGIGWHRDRAVFGDIVGLSLLSPCVFRLRRRAGDAWERASLTAEARSAYLLHGPSRTVWEHSIPPVDALRYSVTFRSLRDRQAGAGDGLTRPDGTAPS